MSTFSDFRKPPQPPSKPLPDSASQDRPAELGNVDYQYVFEHQVLPSVMMADPPQALAILSQPEGRLVLDRILKRMQDLAGPGASKPDFTAGDINLTPWSFDVYSCLLIQFPPPKRVPHAYFAAAVFLPDSAATEPTPQKAALRYITLEMTIDTLQTMLCEWTADRMHKNYGPGPTPDPTAFMEAVKGLILNSRRHGKPRP